MLKVLFCCFMNSAPEPTIELDIIAPPVSPISGYRPDAFTPFTEKEKQYFKNLRQLNISQDPRN